MLNSIIKPESRIVIIGAGPTGLGAAYRLKELGFPNFRVVDAAAVVGGLAASFTDEQGFTWDIGGHVQFSHYKYFDELMRLALGDGWLFHERESWVWIEGRFVPYPFQNNIRHLSPDSRWECIKGLIDLYKNPPRGRPTNFGEWIDATFGKGLAAVFMRPYNFKVWACPPESMDFHWVGERVAVTDLEKVLKNLLEEKDDISWGPNNTFQFPLTGGTGAIWEAVADRVGRERIFLQTPVTKIEPEQKQVDLGNGTTENYDVLINTMPIDRMIDLANLDGLKDAASKLQFSASHIIGVGLSGEPPPALSEKCWMYFPEDDCPFYRVTVFSNYSPQNVPQDRQCWSLMAEVSESLHKPVSDDQSEVIRQTLEGMRATKLINESHEVLSTWYYKANYGYPTPALGRDEVLNRIHPELEKWQIFSRGRFGGWRYEVANQDHSLMQGVELVDWLAHGVPEVTYWFPNTANNLSYAKVR